MNTAIIGILFANFVNSLHIFFVSSAPSAKPPGAAPGAKQGRSTKKKMSEEEVLTRLRKADFWQCSLLHDISLIYDKLSH